MLFIYLELVYQFVASKTYHNQSLSNRKHAQFDLVSGSLVQYLKKKHRTSTKARFASHGHQQHDVSGSRNTANVMLLPLHCPFSAYDSTRHCSAAKCNYLAAVKSRGRSDNFCNTEPETVDICSTVIRTILDQLQRSERLRKYASLNAVTHMSRSGDFRGRSRHKGAIRDAPLRRPETVNTVTRRVQRPL